MVLYGYTKSKADEKHNGHALSGLRSWDLSYGMSRTSCFLFQLYQYFDLNNSINLNTT